MSDAKRGLDEPTGNIVNRHFAENNASLFTRVREMFDDMHLVYAGVGAENARQIDRGIELYLKLNAEKVEPYTIKLVKRDAKFPGDANSRVVVQELDAAQALYDSASALLRAASKGQ